jgi:thymidine kinase
VIALAQIVDRLNIPVIVYGLKNDYRNRLFEGSEALLLFADKIEEIKAVCWHCAKKATMLIKYKDGHPVNEGPQIEIGGNDTYVSVCRKCYSEKVELK